MPSEEQAYLIAESIPHLVWVAGPDGATQYINRRWQDYTGVSVEQAMGWEWQHAIHPEDLPPALDLWRDSLRTGQPYEAEFRLRRADGEYRWHIDRGLPLRDTQGRITHWFGTCTDIEDQKRAAQARSRLAAIVESSEDAILSVDNEGHILTWNPGAERLFGYSAAEVRGKSFFIIVPPELRDEVPPRMAKVEQGACIALFETVRLRKDGRRVEVSVSVAPLRDASGQVIGGSAIIRDITARKQAERALARDALLLANVQDAVIVTDLDGVVTYWNEGATRLFGWTAEELMGRPLTDRVPEEARGQMAEATRAIRDGQDFAGEWEDYRKDGSRVWIDARVTRITDAAGGVVGILGLSHDVSDRKRAEAERNELLARMRLQVERMPLAYLLLDADCRIIDWNSSAERIFGYSKEEVLGMGPPFERILPPAARSQAGDVIRRLRCGDMAAHSLNDNLTKDGRVITCEWFNTPLLDADGRFRGLLSLAQDVTERKRLEEQFLQAQKMEAVGRLAGGVAHDFNNLLTVINCCADLLLEDLGEAAPGAARARDILKAGRRAAALTQQLLAFGRKQIVAPRVLDLNAAVAETEVMLRRLIGDDILLTTDLQPGLGRVRADPTQVQQVTLNLAVNARDAMPQGGRLSIVTREVELAEGDRAGRYVMLEVVDTGCGMTEEVRAHLFEPFFTTKGPGQGTGLGLSTVYGIVRQAGGHIEVDSHPGLGTTFRLYLPRVEGVEEETSPAVVTPAAPGHEAVLLAEDEDGVRALACQVLQSSGYEVLAARDGAEALWLAGKHRRPIDLLVTDVVMPGLDGRGLAERLRALRPAMKVLYLSGYTDDAVVRHGVSQEVAHFLPKPFALDALVRKVREVLDAPATGDVVARR